MTRWSFLAALAVVLPSVSAAQDTTAAQMVQPAASLTLDDALKTARANNPQFRQFLNNTDPARWGVRNAYGSLLPSFSTSAGLNYTGAGQANYGSGLTRQTSGLMGSSYQAGFQWQIDGAKLTAPAQQKANQRATEEDIASQGIALKQAITDQYLTTIQATGQVAVARQQVERNKSFLDLANAKYRVGQGTLLEVRQAEVQKGQADIDLLRNRQLENEAKLELFRRMGVTPPVPVEQVALTDTFAVREPVFSLDSLLTLAEEQNPSLLAVRERAHSAGLGVRSARSAYLPSLALQAGWSGFTQKSTNESLLLAQALSSGQATASNCTFQNQVVQGLTYGPGGIPGQPNGGIIPDCNAFAGLNSSGTALDPAVAQQLHDANSKYPFHFTSQPFQASLMISLPIFTGFSRSLRLSQARAQQKNADEDVRARGLQIQSDINAAYLQLRTAYEAIGVQLANRDAARDQLRLAQDRYRLGSGTSLEVSDAQNAVQRAEGDYVNSVATYQKAFAALEGAVGRPLR